MASRTGTTGTSLSTVFDYSARDAVTVEESMLEFIKNRFPDVYSDYAESGIGIMLMQIGAYIYDLQSYHTDRTANEVYLETARERRNVVELCKLIGYRLSQPTAASVDLELAVADLTPYEATGGKLTVASVQTVAAGSVTFEVVELHTFDWNGAAWVNASTGDVFTSPAGPLVTAAEGVTFSDRFTADQSVFQRYTLSNNPVISDSILVTVAGIEWTRVDSLVLGDPTNPSNTMIYEVSFDEDERATILFGDDITGAKPVSLSTIVVDYRVGGGTVGNVAANAISTTLKVQASTSATAVSEITVQASNPASASGGQARETINSAKFFAPRLLKTNDRAVTKGDYLALCNGYTDGTNGTISKAAVLADPSDGISNVVTVYTWTIDNNNNLLATPSTALKESLKGFLDSRRILTVHVDVVNGVNVVVDVSVSVRVEPGFDSTTVQTQIDDAIAELFREERVRHDNQLRTSWIYDVVIDISGVSWCHVTTPSPDVVTGTAQHLLGSEVIDPGTSGTTTTSYVVLGASASSTDDEYCTYTLHISDVDDPPTIEAIKITDYDGSAKGATMESSYNFTPAENSDTYYLTHPRLIKLAAGASASDDFYNNQVIIINGGTGEGQTRFIIDYDGTTKVATVNANWTTDPDNTSTYMILPDLRCAENEALVAGTVTTTVIPNTDEE